MARSSFSTLKPGRTSATCAAGRRHVGFFLFQYPQTGSNLCNNGDYQPDRWQGRLSVPSNRVEPLQLVLLAGGMWVFFSFSTLKPGRTSATTEITSLTDGKVVFQYPQTGSNLCNLCCWQEACGFFSLSVPSNRV